MFETTLKLATAYHAVSIALHLIFAAFPDIAIQGTLVFLRTHHTRWFGLMVTEVLASIALATLLGAPSNETIALVATANTATSFFCLFQDRFLDPSASVGGVEPHFPALIFYVVQFSAFAKLWARADNAVITAVAPALTVLSGLPIVLQRIQIHDVASAIRERRNAAQADEENRQAEEELDEDIALLGKMTRYDLYHFALGTTLHTMTTALILLL